MGILLSILKGGQPDQDPVVLNIDFNAAPTDGEVLYLQAQGICAQFDEILKALEEYQGCGEFIRQAISSPGKQNDEAAWGAILPAVSKLKYLYEFAQQLESIFPKIINFLCTEEPEKVFEASQATAYQLSTILSFAMQFDLIKMGNPNIQNDFSYYRRTVSRMKIGNVQGVVVVGDELANRMSLFFAHSNPISKALIDAIQVQIQMKIVDGTRVADCFSILANVCLNQITKQNTQPQGDILYLRVMVAAILFYDHVHPQGAFIKESRVNIKGGVKVIQGSGGMIVEPLMNVLKFSTVHLNSDTTPKSIKQLFA